MSEAAPKIMRTIDRTGFDLIFSYDSDPTEVPVAIVPPFGVDKPLVQFFDSREAFEHRRLPVSSKNTAWLLD